MSKPTDEGNAEPDSTDGLAEETRSGEVAPAHSRRWSDHPRYEVRAADPKYVDREPERHFSAQTGEDPTTAYGRIPPGNLEKQRGDAVGEAGEEERPADG